MRWLWWVLGAFAVLAFVEMDEDPVLGVRLLALVALAIGLWVFGRNLRRALAAARPGGSRPPVVVSQTELLVGEPFTVRAGGGAAPRELRASLVFTERVHGQGDGAHRDIVVRTATGPGDRPLELWIPEDGMHSFRSDHNELAWRLDVEVVGERGKVAGQVPLTVRPAVAW